MKGSAPAFPFPCHPEQLFGLPSGAARTTFGYPGMSLRTYIAVEMATVYLADFMAKWSHFPSDKDRESIRQEAFAMADTMLAVEPKEKSDASQDV